MAKLIVIVLALAVVLGFLFWRYGPQFGGQQLSNQEVSLTIWGLWEEDTLIKPALDEYKRSLPADAGKKTNINYVHQSSVNYRTRVQTQISSEGGPDIILIHNSWLPMFLKGNLLAVLPESVMSANDFSQAFYPAVVRSVTHQSKIYGLAREIDGLALFYNEDILKAAGVGVPQSWDQFRDAAVKTTVIDSTGQIKTAGAAFGATGNVDHWPEIIGLLFLQQPGAKLETPDSAAAQDPNSFPGADIIRFYTNFVTDPRQKVWDTNLEPSTQAFAQGRVAFYFAPSWRAHELRQLNPQLNFKTAPVPQLPGGQSGWGTFWVYAVSNRSPVQKEAWEFLKFLTSVETQKLLYQEAAKVRLFGLPYSRMELQSQLADDPIVGAFVNQGSIYKSWYLNSRTFDQGINDQIIKYYEDAINATLNGADPKTVLQTTSKGIEQVLSEYQGYTQTPTGR